MSKFAHKNETEPVHPDLEYNGQIWSIFQKGIITKKQE